MSIRGRVLPPCYSPVRVGASRSMLPKWVRGGDHSLPVALHLGKIASKVLRNALKWTFVIDRK